MTSWKTVRIWLFATLFIGVVFVLVKSILFPHIPNSKVAPFVFPTTVPLSEWQLLDSVPSKITTDPNFIASRRYRYQKDDLSLNIDMHYIINSSGSARNYAKQHILPQKSTTPFLMRKLSGVGFHTLFTYQEKAFLSSCINPRGGSTVTFDQFMENRNTYDIGLGRLLLWLLGLQELRDLRCMWSVLSVPLKTATPEEVYPILESAWFSWYSWWESRFPQP